jgi:hypothetical protein
MQTGDHANNENDSCRVAGRRLQMNASTSTVWRIPFADVAILLARLACVVGISFSVPTRTSEAQWS